VPPSFEQILIDLGASAAVNARGSDALCAET
jgi:hypothetical protein